MNGQEKAMAGEDAATTEPDASQSQDAEQGFVSLLVSEVTSSPLNMLLVALIVVLVYKIFKPRDRTPVAEPVVSLPPLRKDMTVAQLREYDGSRDDGRLLIAVNGIVFDVTAGRRFYGPGGPYAAFAGRDASRGLATFNVMPSEQEYDDLSDLNSQEMESIREWEEQFKERYKIVGRLLRPGEEPTNYSEEETEPDTPSAGKKDN